MSNKNQLSNALKGPIHTARHRAIEIRQINEEFANVPRLDGDVTITGNWTFTQPVTFPVNSIPFQSIQHVGSHSIIGRFSSISGEIQELSIPLNSIPGRMNIGSIQALTAGVNGVLRRAGSGGLDFGLLVTGNYGNATVTLAKLAADVGILTSVTTNANGTSIRFQLGGLGIQLCFHKINLGSRIAQGAGTLVDPFSTAFSSWTFPQAFDSPPTCAPGNQVDAASASGRFMTISWDDTTATQMTVIRASATSSSNEDVDVIAHLWAIGTYTP